MTREQEEDDTLRITLSAEGSSSGSHVSWREDVVDNEFLNKKKSNGIHNSNILVCCIYKKDCHSDTSESESYSDQEYKGKNIGKPNNYEKVRKYKKKT